ncbi:MAG: LptA/OstA family protein [Armatimonadota bacterium]|nr:LptA/OstA family protein [Armatimonadota bacterium]
MRRLWLVLVLTAASLYPQQQGGQEIRFGAVQISYDTLVSTRRIKDEVVEVEVRGGRGIPVRLDSPEQHFSMTCAQLKATLAPNEQRQLTVRKAEATGQVNFRYNRPQPLSRLNGYAQRVVYESEKRTITFEGNVSLDGEDEFYIMRWRDNERIIVYLAEDLQRVEAISKVRDGVPVGTMTIQPKQRQ